MKYRIMPRKRRMRSLAPEAPDSFWLVDLPAISPKEQLSHLEHPFFGLSKIPRKGVRRYEDGWGGYLELSPEPRFGLPTIFDQDIVIYATSMIIAERNRRAKNPHALGESRISDGVIQFSTADFAELTGRTVAGRRPGGSWYDNIEGGLRRLVGTRLETNFVGGGVVKTDMFGMIDRATIVRTEGLRKAGLEGGLLGCQVKLSDWMLEPIKNNRVLTLDRDYFRLRRPLDRRLYQIVRKHCGGRDQWKCPIPQLWSKAGSEGRQREFRYRFRDFVARWDELREEQRQDFLGFRVGYDAEADMLVAHRLNERIESAAALGFGYAPEPWARPIIAQELPDWDAQTVWSDWLYEKVERSGPPSDMKAALVGYCKAKARRGKPKKKPGIAAEPFPEEGGITYNDAVMDIWRANAWTGFGQRDPDLVANEFRSWREAEERPLDAPDVLEHWARFVVKASKPRL